MSHPDRRPLVFIGSSSEGLDLAYDLQRDLSRRDRGELCECFVWTQEVFDPGGVALDDLVRRVGESDFAVLIATPDDVLTTRGSTKTAVRDNVILELGMAIGLLGRRRSYLVADHSTGSLNVPSDLAGVTHIPYRSGTNLAAAVGPVATDVARRVRELGPRPSHPTASLEAPARDRKASASVDRVAPVASPRLAAHAPEGSDSVNTPPIAAPVPPVRTFSDGDLIMQADRLKPSPFGGIEVHGRIRNSGTQRCSMAIIRATLIDAGAMVGSALGTVSDLEPGASKVFQLDGDESVAAGAQIELQIDSKI